MKRTPCLVTVTAMMVAGLDAASVSTDFDYKYEMDVAPSTLDLDTNGTDDFFAGNGSTAGAEQNNVSYAGGIGTFRDDNTGANSSVLRTDYSNSLWRNLFLSDNTWTAEASVRVLVDSSFPQGANGTLIMSGGIGGVTPVLRIYQDRVIFSNGGADVTYLDGTDFTSAFYTFRVARDADGDGWLWVNDVLIAQKQAPRTGLSGGNANGFFMGGESFSSSVNGAWDIDYVRLDTDFIPVPEPSSVALLGVGGLMLFYRRRR